MKALIITLLAVSIVATSCVKGDRKNMEWKIEATSSNVVNVYYKTRDDGSQQVTGINQGSWMYEWKGYHSNDITIMIECDGAGSVKIYRKGKLVKENSGTNSVTVNYEE